MQDQDKDLLGRMLRTSDLPDSVIESYRRVAHLRGILQNGPMDVATLLLVITLSGADVVEPEADPVAVEPAEPADPGLPLKDGASMVQGQRYYVRFNGGWRAGAYDGRAAHGKLRFKVDHDEEKKFRLVDPSAVRILTDAPVATKSEV